jgi:hypothetical protein
MTSFKEWLLESIQFRNTIHLFRGVGGTPAPADRIGRWWSTNPYYSIRYGENRVGHIFHAAISKSDLEDGLENDSIVDVSQDEYPNYVFKNDDPAGAKSMTEEELQQFRILSGKNKPEVGSGRPGGDEPLFRQLWGQEAIDAAYQVYDAGKH